MEIIKITRESFPLYPLFTRKMKVGDLDKSKCSIKFLAHNLSADEFVNIKCYQDGTLDLRGKKKEYRIIYPIFNDTEKDIKKLSDEYNIKLKEITEISTLLLKKLRKHYTASKMNEFKTLNELLLDIDCICETECIGKNIFKAEVTSLYFSS